MGKIEEIVLRHSGRGMDILRPFLSENFYEEACRQILSWKRGVVFLTTGFYVAGYAETDGPAGTVALGKALEALGFQTIILTDSFCKDYFEMKDFSVEYAPMDANQDYFENLIQKYNPIGCISIERCGMNTNGDYANMRGISIAEHTAPIDKLFEQVKGTIPTMGIGDGGNEIGMGNLVEQITEKLTLVPCKITVDFLLLATVSNWGAYGLAACLSMAVGKRLLMTADELVDYIAATVSMGSLDGVKKEQVVSVDGFPIEVEREIIDTLLELL